MIHFYGVTALCFRMAIFILPGDSTDLTNGGGEDLIGDIGIGTMAFVPTTLEVVGEVGTIHGGMGIDGAEAGMIHGATTLDLTPGDTTDMAIGVETVGAIGIGEIEMTAIMKIQKEGTTAVEIMAAQLLHVLDQSG